MLRLKCLLTIFCLTSLASSTASASPKPHPLVTPAQMTQTRWVDHCEEQGNWRYPVGSSWAKVVGEKYALAHSLYYGGLGWRPATWLSFRSPTMPALMSQASPIQQAWALVQFAKVYGMPDLNGTCHGY